ncbi:MAG: DNA repair protein RecO [Defluviitaleaceae bacterium]|nr:DNA repair protein RecO [Defluviitaleaceae bacterium]
MQTIKARGLVLREYEAGESDKRLLLLCKEHGRMMIYARGARKPKSKFMAAAQLFTYADFVITVGRGFHALAQAQIIENFYGLRTDYDRLTAAHLLAEVCEKTLLENIACDDLLRLALRALSHLSKPLLPPLHVIGVFFMRFYAYYGFAPEVDTCVTCGSDVESGAFFSSEGLVCAVHKPGYGIPFSRGAVYALRHIMGSDLAVAFRFKAHDDVLQELWQSARMLWRFHFEWKLVSEAFMV